MTKLFPILLLAISLQSCSGFTYKERTNEQSSDTPLSYTLEKTVLNDTSRYYTVSIEYPLAKTTSAGGNQAFVDAFNQSMKTMIDSLTLQYRGEQLDSLKKLINETRTSGKFETYVKYKTFLVSDHYLGLKLEIYEYTLGAHGFTSQRCLNFSVPDGKLLKLTDVLDLDGGKLSTLNSLLVQCFENPDSCFDGKPEISENYPRFSLDDEELVFTFEAYELGPYACGEASIPVPYSLLRKSNLLKVNLP